MHSQARCPVCETCLTCWGGKMRPLEAEVVPGLPPRCAQCKGRGTTCACGCHP